MVTTLSGSLRLGLSLLVVGVAGYAGLVQRSPWIILPMAVAFTLLYVAGKWTTWSSAHAEYGTAKTLLQFAATLPVQLMVSAVCYLLGFGLASLLGTGVRADRLGTYDWTLLGILLAIALPLSVVITRLEDGDKRDDRDVPQFDRPSALTDEPEPMIDPRPVQPESFFTGPHFTHHDYSNGKAEGLPDAARTKPGQISATEQRLGVSLPPLLRELYERQNGGLTGHLLVPVVDDPRPIRNDWRAVFSHDYDELKPLEDLRTYYDHFLEWGDPDDPDDLEQIPTHAKEMIVLSMRYADTTYLDYSKPGEPTIGIVDFDPYSPEAKVYFDTFADFFAALRRGS